ncbi:VWA domain-containing protein [Chelativorans sp. M5D2P16]|uniref:VWA domain-containing protein n=1 Tax=Chelativorans sp. M5D2P16 TaxID=3095678 RepID=UPI002ACA3724|nr:VWA domain-containing protein [Chelativorans sp. M5D2P16]MDZ5699810.1 VWA domain-containing protein [Chelativorans sp. M5D2P16]
MRHAASADRRTQPLPRLPRECAPFLDFVQALRRHGFAVAPDQTVSFLAAVALLGPKSMEHIRRAAIATLAPPLDRQSTFDALFRAVFFGEARVAAVQNEEEEEILVKDQGGAEAVGEILLQREKGGAHASAAERLSTRAFDNRERSLRAFQRQLPDALPRRRTFRHLRTRSKGMIDLRRSFRDIVHADGDLASPRLRRRKEIARRLLLIIDISGSMREHTDGLLELAHAAVQAAPGTEVFTIGTRLSRITTALRSRDRAQALERAAVSVDDWDGGTRIGPSLKAFLAVPRFVALARGSLVVLASDGLERGGHAEFESAVRRLSALANRLSLATPLAGDPRFRPETAALASILPWLDDLVDGSSGEALARFILSLGRQAPRAAVLRKEEAHAARH